MGDWNYLRKFREALRGPLDHLYDFSDANLVPEKGKNTICLVARSRRGSSWLATSHASSNYSSLP